MAEPGNLVDGLKQAQSDSERASILYRDILQSLPGGERQSLLVLATPHWFSRDILSSLAQRDKTFAGLAKVVDQVLLPRGLVSQSHAGTTFAVVDGLRSLALDGVVADDPKQFRWQSELFAKAFADTGRSEAELVERVYHQLGADPDQGGPQLLDAALFLGAEPLFARDAVDRLATVADEQRRRGVLTAACDVYLRYVQLLVPRLRPQEAGQELDEVRKLRASVKGDQRFAAQLDLALGRLLLITGGALDKADSGLKEAGAIFDAAGDARGVAEARLVSGRIALRRDDYAAARDHFDAARTIFAENDLKVSAAHCDRSVAEIDWLQGRLADAERGFRDALARFENAGSLVTEANTRLLLAQVLALLGRFEEAEGHVARARPVFETLNQRVGLAQAHKASAVVLIERDKIVEAEAELRQALPLYPPGGPGAANCKMLLAATLARLDRFDEAEHLLAEARATFERMQDRFSLAIAMRETGLLDERRRSFAAAVDHLGKAALAFAALGSPVEQMIAEVALCRVALVSGALPGIGPREVTAAASRALAVFEREGLPRRIGEARHLLDMAAAQLQLAGAAAAIPQAAEQDGQQQEVRQQLLRE